MNELVLKRIEKETLPKLSDWVNTDRKVNKLTFSTFRKFFNARGLGNLEVNSKFIFPASEEEFEVISEILLYINQNPDSKGINEIINSRGFDKMLENISKN